MLHIGYLKSGSLAVKQAVSCIYDEPRRESIRKNHTATHLLNFALRAVLGEDCDQRGSLVAPDKLRFDFSCKRALTDPEIGDMEKIVQSFIAKSSTVYSEPTPLHIARQINGLRAVFGEVYPDPVRVVSVGMEVSKVLADPSSVHWRTTTMEFCGGTHVSNTSVIQHFYVTQEEGIAKGTRRITAVTGKEATKAKKESERLRQRIREISDLPAKEQGREIVEASRDLESTQIPMLDKIEMRGTLKQLKDKVDDQEKAEKATQVDHAVKHIKAVIEKTPDAPFLVEVLHVGSNTKALLQAINEVKSISPNTAVMLLSPDAEAGRVSHMCAVSDAIAEKGLTADKWAKELEQVVGGKSGGKKTAAQGTGTDVGQLSAAVDIAKQFAKLKLNA